jgi:hypothetical protein
MCFDPPEERSKYPELQPIEKEDLFSILVYSLLDSQGSVGANQFLLWYP